MAGIHIRILMVDDDHTCLHIAKEYLQRMNHQVVAMSNPVDALFTIQMNYDSFDLILTDVHMPQMSGLDLLRRVKEQFHHIPVVLMSVNSNKDIMRKGLEDGASFYLVKPITEENLSKLWQFAVSGFILSQRNTFETQENVIQSGNYNNPNNNIRSLMTSFEDHNENNILSNMTMLKRTSLDPNQVHENVSKKPKLIWTTSLHNLFLEAVNKIGLKKAVPKKIMEHMNVPGLRRENVASHLQKYRIFLKRMAEASKYSEDGVPSHLNERPLRSSFVLNEITYLTNNFHQQYQELLTKGRKVDNDINPNFNGGSEGNNNNNTIGNVQSTVNNYVGLRISTNGELVGPLKDMTISYNNHVGENSGSNINNNNNNNNNNNVSQNAQNTSFGISDVSIGEPSDASLRGMANNVNLFFSDFDHEALLQAPEDMPTNEEPFGTSFGFESFDILDNGFEGFSGLDQGIFLNDDTSFENYYAQEFGQQNNGDSNQDHQDGNFANES